MEIKLAVVMINQNQDNDMLKKCVESIKLQKCKFGKGLVVGGAQYNTAELLNKGLELSLDANYILYINTNEELKAGYIDKCMSVFNNNINIAAVYTDYDKIYHGGIREYLPSFNRMRITQGSNIPTTAIFKKEVFDSCGSFDSSLEILENWDMWLRISEKYPLYHIPESLYLKKNSVRQYHNEDTISETKKYILEKAKQRTNGK